MNAVSKVSIQRLPKVAERDTNRQLFDFLS